MVSQEILVSVAHLSLIQRVVKHNHDHKFDPPLTVYKLRKLYKQHGISFKRIKMRLKWRRVNDDRGMAKDKAVFDALRAAVE